MKVKLIIIAALSFLSLNLNAQENPQSFANKLQLTFQAGASFNASKLSYSNGYLLNVNFFGTYDFTKNVKAGIGYQSAGENSFKTLYATGIIQPSFKKIIPYARFSIGKSVSGSEKISGALMTGFSAGINTDADQSLAFNLELGYKIFRYTEDVTPSIQPAIAGYNKSYLESRTSSLFDFTFGMSLRLPK